MYNMVVSNFLLGGLSYCSILVDFDHSLCLNFGTTRKLNYGLMIPASHYRVKATIFSALLRKAYLFYSAFK